MSNKVLVSLNEINKSFGTVKASNNISLEFYSNEIHSLLGENGAGKSTLMNILSGLYSPDSGSICIENKNVNLTTPKEAISKGIGMIHQHFKLVEVMTAKENIIAGHEKKLFINGKKLSEDIKAISSKYGLEIDPDKKVYNMSVAEKQRLEILKVLYRRANILILDEPSAVLTPQETDKLFDILRKMKADGCSIIIITHKLNEVMEISDKISVLRKGTIIKTLDKDKTTPRELTDMMVGRSVDLAIERIDVNKKQTLLKIEDLVIEANNQRVLDGVTFELNTGEILGVAGVAGSGQKELCEAIAGLQSIKKGSISYKDQEIVGKNPRDIISMGISMSFVPEDRLGMGLVASMDLVDNILLKEYQNQKSMFLSRKPSKEKAELIVDKLDISTPSIHHRVSKLSGGNIQKVLLGREIETNPSLMITAYPARGLDINAAHTVYDLLNEQKQKDIGILFIGEDLDVLIELCDRVMVLCDGQITGIVDSKDITKEEIGFLMAGERLDNLDDKIC